MRAHLVVTAATLGLVAGLVTGAPVSATPSPECATTLPTTRKVVALTFDAGANAAGIQRILRVLRREKVPATFFLTGAWTRAYPDYARRITERGYTLGNHSDSHPHFPQLSGAAQRAELRVTEQTVKAITGHTTRPFFRFPFGEYDTRALDRVAALGYACVGWTVDTAGWLGTSGGQSRQTVLARVLGGLRPGEIVLMHVGSNAYDGSTLDAATLGTVIEALRARGYGFTSVERLRPRAPGQD